MFDDPGPQVCDVHPGGRRAITRGSMTYGAEAGAHQLVETGEHDVQNRQVHHRRRLRLAGWLAGRIRWRRLAPASRGWPAASQDAPNSRLGWLEHRRLPAGYYTVTVAANTTQPTRTRSHDELHERGRRLSELNCSIPH